MVWFNIINLRPYLWMAGESLARLLRAKILLEKPGKKRGDDAHSFNAFFKLPSLWTVLKNGA